MSIADTLALLSHLADVFRVFGVYIVVPILAYKVIRNPPPWAKRLSLKSASVLGTRVEFEPLPQVEEKRELSATATAIVEAPPPNQEDPTTALAEVETTEDKKGAFDLLRAGAYAEGIELIRRRAVQMTEKGEDAFDFLAFAYYYAYRTAGTEQALTDLKALGAANPQHSAVQLWVALAIQDTEQDSVVLRQFELALSSATNERQRITVVGSLTVFLAKRRLFDQALQKLKERLRATLDPGERASIFRHFAHVYETMEGQGTYNAMLMYEQAIRYAPADASLRFDVAYKYGDVNAYSIALHHYGSVISQQPEHQSALNNAGIAAQNVGFPILGVAFLRRAERAGSALASTNLARTLLSVGFVDEAREAIANARRLEHSERRVDSVAGQVANAEQQEEAGAEEAAKYVEKIREWRLRQAEGMLQETLAATAFAGEYIGDFGKASLTARDDGLVIGSFERGVFSGSGEFFVRPTGTVLFFTWQSAGAGSTLLTSFGKQSGHGLLILDGDTLSGYYVVEPISVDAKPSTTYVELRLRRLSKLALALPSVRS